MYKKESFRGRGKLSRTCRPLVMLLVSIAILGASNVFVHVNASDGSIVELVVTSRETGKFIANATIYIWKGHNCISGNVTDEYGHFRKNLDPGTYNIYVKTDDPSTLGNDYVPYNTEIMLSANSSKMLRVALTPGASVILEGDIQFVDTENLPRKIGYEVEDSETETVMTVDGFHLEYGTSKASQSEFIGLSPTHLIVPIEKPFDIEVNATVLLEKGLTQRTFKIDEPRITTLVQGELLQIDVGEYMLRYNLQDMEILLADVEEKVYGMEEDGFYLTVEKGVLATAINQIDNARSTLQTGRYIDGFKNLKTEYIALNELVKGLNMMYEDAIYSVYILVLFIGAASTLNSYFIFNNSAKQVIGAVASSIAFLSLLQYTFPGVRYITPEAFTSTSVLAVGTTIALATLIPRILKSGETDSGGSLLNMIVPIFSIAKRGLKRRKMRLILTLLSVIMFVMAFVVLTSFSLGYGLITRRVSTEDLPVNGVMIRDKAWEEELLTFININEATMQWMQNQPESFGLARKVENLASLIPYTSSNEYTIRGIIGIDASEDLFTSIKDIVVEGSYIDGTAGQALISITLRDKLDFDLGDQFSLRGLTLNVVGFFDNDRLKNKRDIDGSTFLPGKLVSIGREEDLPEIFQETCEPEETIISDIETALRLPLTGISRIDILVGGDHDARDFSERLALERGYRTLSSSGEGVYTAQLGTSLQWKGFPVLIPGLIVVLNVGAMMLNAMFERRKEINILSAIGLNPAQISAIFVAEAVIIGGIGGGIGYLLGISLYKPMALLKLTVEVGQKVSAAWSLGAVGISMAAVVVGATLALKWSVGITPSLKRRWRIEPHERNLMDPYIMKIPFKVNRYELNEFSEYVLKVLRSYSNDPLYKTESITVQSIGDQANIVKQITFIHRATTITVGQFYTKNVIIIEKTEDELYCVKLVSSGEREWAHKTGSFVRHIALAYSTNKKQF